ncbi:MAG TPA: hypothetical protein VGE33_11045 [Thermomonas sp.]
MLRIGSRTVLHTTTFILPSEEEAVVEFSSEDVDAKFRLRFLEDAADKGNVSFTVEPDPESEERGLITLVNWNRPNRVSTPDAISVMDLPGFDVWLLASSMYANSKYHVTLQFMKGEKE